VEFPRKRGRSGGFVGAVSHQAGDLRKSTAMVFFTSDYRGFLHPFNSKLDCPVHEFSPTILQISGKPGMLESLRFLSMVWFVKKHWGLGSVPWTKISKESWSLWRIMEPMGPQARTLVVVDPTHCSAVEHPWWPLIAGRYPQCPQSHHTSCTWWRLSSRDPASEETQQKTENCKEYQQ
jgi:hypothetical protein